MLNAVRKLLSAFLPRSSFRLRSNGTKSTMPYLLILACNSLFSGFIALMSEIRRNSLLFTNVFEFLKNNPSVGASALTCVLSLIVLIFQLSRRKKLLLPNVQKIIPEVITLVKDLLLRLPNSPFKSDPVDPGQPIKDVKMRSVDEHGNPILKKIGTKNTDAEIQSYKEETDYTAMFERMEAGDPIAERRAPTVLNLNNDLSFGDFSKKTDLRDLAHSIIEAHDIYQSAGGSAIGMSFEEFLQNAEIKTGLKSDLKSDPVPEVKPDEQK